MDPAEDQMRKQMFKTMVALERAANAVFVYFEGENNNREQVPPAPMPDELHMLQKQVRANRQALGVVAEFAQFRDTFLGTKPADQVARCVKTKACPECVGTGWIARDETCKACNRTGYLQV